MNDRLREWTGSVVCSGVLCVVLAVLGTLVVMGTNAMSLGVFLPMAVWIASIVWIASAAVMGLNKLWEGRPEDGLLFRFQQIAVGLLVGGMAWGIDNYLALPWHETYRSLVMHNYGASPQVITQYLQDHYRAPAMFFEGGRPLLPAYLSFFAVLFGGIRWWRLGDRVRRHRFSFTAVVFSIVLCFFLTNLLYFPVHFALTFAGSLAVVTQLSAYWSNWNQKPTPTLVSES